MDEVAWLCFAATEQKDVVKQCVYWLRLSKGTLCAESNLSPTRLDEIF